MTDKQPITLPDIREHIERMVVEYERQQKIRITAINFQWEIRPWDETQSSRISYLHRIEIVSES